MNYGIKVSERGVDVIDSNASMTKKEKEYDISHILASLAVPYLNGANTQIKRYQNAASKLKSHPVDACNECLHEISCLFEDLATIAKYIEMCDETNNLHSVFWDVRNLIRHDIRDNFDNTDSYKKNECAKRLGIPDGLQISIGYNINYISVGTTIINKSDLTNYLGWAGKIILDKIASAQIKGYIKK